MARIIQDSDDEEAFDEEDVVIEKEQTRAPDAAAVASECIKDGTQVPAGTGSTESFRKAYREAHHAQFVTTNSTLDATTGHFGTSLSPLAQNQAESKDTPAIVPAGATVMQKPPASSSKSKSLTSSPFIHQLHAQKLGKAASLDDRPTQHVPSIEDTHLESMQNGSENGWVLEGTIRVNYAGHEPMALFPDPSSTISNTTATQERLLQEVMAPGFLGLGLTPDPDIEPVVSPHKPESSVPWSEYLRTQPEDRQLPVQRPEVERLSQCSAPDSPEPSTNKAPKTNALKDTYPDLLLDDISTITDRTTVTEPDSAQGLRDVSANICSPLATALIQAKKSESTPPSPKRKKRKASQMVDSDDYLEEIELPKEQYKPRPSRSRSLKTHIEESASHLVQPEKVTKKRARRSKTANEAENGDVISTPQKIKQICDMGFTPVSTRSALKINRGNINKSIDWLVTKAAENDEDELAPARISQPKSQVGIIAKADFASQIQDGKRHSWSAQNESISERNSIASDAGGNIDWDGGNKSLHMADLPLGHNTPAKVEVVIPRSKDPITGSGASPLEPEKSSKVDESERTENKSAKCKSGPEVLESSLISPDVPPLPRGKRRGRPKKTTVAPPVSSSLEDETGAARNDDTHREAVPLEPAKGTEDHGNATAKEPSPPDEEAPPTPPPNPRTPITDIHTPEPQTRPSNGRFLPSSQGKYRVGLSKRVRIAPLLRVMKK